MRAVAEALLQEIGRAFAGVVRAGGVTLSGSVQLDHYVSPERIVEPDEARRLDPGTDWSAIPDDWLTRFGGVGGFSFMDAAGFRYYLPAVMTRFVREAEGDAPAGSVLCESLVYHLARSRPPLDPLDHFSILSEAQARVVCRFLEYVATSPGYEPDDVQVALDGYWKKRLETD